MPAGYDENTVFVDNGPPYIPEEIWWFAANNNFELPLNAEKCNLIWKLIYPEIKNENKNLLIHRMSIIYRMSGDKE